MDLTQLLRAITEAYQQNIGQPFANVAGPFGRGLLGLERPEYGQEQAYRTGQAVGNMPAVSAPVGLLKAAAQAPEVLKAAQALPELAGLLGATVFHGSPYAFKKFDPTKIGSGEGAQAYGYGHYVAESPAVAQAYREALSKNVSVDGAKLQTIPSDSPLAEAHNMVVRNIQSGMKPEDAIFATQKYWSDAADEIKTFAKTNPELSNRIEQEAISRMQVSDAAKTLKPSSFYLDPGSLYKIDLPDEQIAKMLDWDKPLGKQSLEVRKAIESTKKMLPQNAIDDLGGDLSLMYGKDVTPEQFLNTWEALGVKAGGESALQKLGIPGIRYLDQGSRGSGQGTSNFVIFPGNEGLLKILERNNQPIVD